MQWLVQKALDIALYSNVIYDGKVVPTYDNTPANPTLPYIRYGNTTVNEWNSKLHYGKDMTQTIHIFSNKGWSQEVKEIMTLIEMKLREPIVLTELSVIIFNIEFQEVLESVNGVHHGIMRFRLRMEE